MSVCIVVSVRMTALGTLGALASPPCGAHRRAASDHRQEPLALRSHEAPAPSPQPGPQVCRCREGEPRELCSHAQAHTVHTRVHTCQRARTEPSHQRCAAHARVLPGCAVRDSGWVCGPFQGMTTGPRDSHPRGRGSHRACTSWSPGLSLRGGAVFTCLLCPWVLQPRAWVPQTSLSFQRRWG